MPSPLPSRVRAAAAILIVAAAGRAVPAQTAAPLALHQVAAARCTGGSFTIACFAARAPRLLTFGHLGDAILWDLPAATPRRRFAPAPGHVRAVRIHPRDPWAVVLAEHAGASRAFRFDFGGERYHTLFDRPVADVAFDDDGLRAAVLFAATPRERVRVAAYAEAALRALRPPPADFERSLDAGSSVRFSRDGSALLVRTSSPVVWRLPLDGRPPDDRGPPDDGPMPPPCTIERWTVTRLRQTQVSWDLLPRDSDLECLAIAPDGTLAVADDQGALELLGPSNGRRTLRGHDGPATQLAFTADARWLLIAGSGTLLTLHLETRTTQRLDGTFGVQPASGSRAILLARDRLSIFDAATGACDEVPVRADELLLAHCVPLPGHDVQRCAFSWDAARARLWLGIGGADADTLLLPARGSRVTVPRPQFRALYPHLRCESLAPLAGGMVLAADGLLPARNACCGNGSEGVELWGALRVLDERGRVLRSVFPAGPPRVLRVAPDGHRALLAVDSELRLLDATRLVTRARVRVPQPIAALEFVDDDSALALDTDGILRLVELPALRVRCVPLPAGSVPERREFDVERLAIARGHDLVAIARGAEVRVLRLQRSTGARARPEHDGAPLRPRRR